MSAYKKLNQQDSYISTHNAQKSWEVGGSKYGEHGIYNIVGLSGSGAYYPLEEDVVYGGGGLSLENSVTASFNRRLVYRSTRQLYFSLFENEENIASGSYENYLQSSYDVSGSRYLTERVAIFSLSKESYGTHIEPNSVTIRVGTGNVNVDNYVIDGYSVADPSSNIFDPANNLYTENSSFIFMDTGVVCSLETDGFIVNEGDYVDESEEAGGEYVDGEVGETSGGSANEDCNVIVDDGEGRLYFKDSIPRYYVGNVIYPQGQLIITDDVVAIYYNHFFNARINWKSNLPIYTHNYHCKIKSSEYNHTLNKSGLDIETGKINDNISGSFFTPYITTVGLYNDANDLIAVAKMAQPVPKSADTDMTIKVQLDMNFGIDRFGDITEFTPQVGM